jgi:hypothetical protein
VRSNSITRKLSNSSHDCLDHEFHCILPVLIFSANIRDRAIAEKDLALNPDPVILTLPAFRPSAGAFNMKTNSVAARPLPKR